MKLVYCVIQFSLALFSSCLSETEQTCNAADRDPTPECWNILNVTGYLQNWWAANQAKCMSGPYAGVGFTSCYQQLVGKGKLLNRACNDISPAPCDAAPDFVTYSPVEYYVLQSIFGIWWWFSSIWYASSEATIVAEAKIGHIVSIINPVKPGDTSLGLVLSALSAGFAFISVPAEIGVSVGTQIASQSITALQQAPGLGKALLPTGSLDTQFKQLIDIESSMGDVLSQFHINIANALNATQSDFGLFVNVSQNGAYIAKQQSLNASTTQLTRILKTFIVSQALQANNIIITVAKGTNPYEVTPNLSASSSTIAQSNAWHVNCHDAYEQMPYGVCDNWWYDGKDAYSLSNLGERNQNYHDLMIQMFQEGWTTGEDLFYQAARCHQESAIYREGYGLPRYSEPESTSSGFGGQLAISPASLDASCSSNVRFCVWNQTHDPGNKDGRELEYVYRGWYSRVQIMGVEIAVKGLNWNELVYGDNGMSFGEAAAFLQGSAALWEPCLLASPYNCGWMAISGLQQYDSLGAYTRLKRPLIQKNAFPDTLPKELTKDYDTPTEENFGWGGAGYVGFRGIFPCDEYPASYIGDGLWTKSILY